MSRKKPTPEKGQIWAFTFNNSPVQVDVIERVETSPNVRRAWFSDGKWLSFAQMAEDDCRCIGIETEYGKVMVEERRRNPFDSLTYQVVEVCVRAMVRFASLALPFPALAVTRWPLVAVVKSQLPEP